jgi:hypothetical protein
LIRNREVTSVEVVQAHLDRIDAINPKINAIVTWAAGALDAAVAADEALAAGAAVGPLHGVPFTVKDSIDTADVITQRGSPIFKGRSPDADATSVARIRNAGGILIAKTNLPEFSYSTESDNLLTGKTNNPLRGGQLSANLVTQRDHGGGVLGDLDRGTARCVALKAVKWRLIQPLHHGPDERSGVGGAVTQAAPNHQRIAVRSVLTAESLGVPGDRRQRLLSAFKRHPDRDPAVRSSGRPLKCGS